MLRSLLVCLLSLGLAGGLALPSGGETPDDAADALDERTGLHGDVFVIRPGRDLRLVLHQPGVYGLLRGETYPLPGSIAPSGRLTLIAVGEGPRPKVVAPKGFLDRSRNPAHHVTVRGLHITAGDRGPDSNPTGIRWTAGGEHITIEDCIIEGFRDNITFERIDDPIRHVTIRNNIIRGAWAVDAHSQGLYAAGVENLIIEGNLFDRNGWNQDHPTPGRDKFNHNVYIQTGEHPAILRQNVIARAASHGFQLRSGGVAEGNLLILNPIAGFVAMNPSIVQDNIVLLPADMPHGEPRGWGIDIGTSDHPVPAAEVRGNLIAYRIGSQSRPAIGVPSGSRGLRLIDNRVDRSFPTITDAERDQVSEQTGNIWLTADAPVTRVEATLQDLLDRLNSEQTTVEQAIEEVRAQLDDWLEPAPR